MSQKPVSAEQIATIYEQLHRIGNLGPSIKDGFLRAGYSAEESAAIELIANECRTLGLDIRFDALGNVVAESTSVSGKFIEFASHLDTVPYGGNFDGAAGVVAGLEAIRSLLHGGTFGPHGLRLRIWRLEESSTFNAACMGSRAAFGICDPKVLSHEFREQSIYSAMQSQGFDPTVLERRQATISTEEKDSILAHFELHIEQANLLETSAIDIGIITSIRGPRRARIIVEGRFDHSGGTPMGVRFRKDVNLAIAYMQVRVDELFHRENAEAENLVQTVGVVNSERAINSRESRVYQNAAPKVSGFGYFVYELRGSNRAAQDSFWRKAISEFEAVAEEFNVKISVEIVNESAGIENLDITLQLLLERACHDLGVSSLRMSSGAMHDAAIVANQNNSAGDAIPVGMIFIPCRDGISHNPDEFTSDSAIAKGASVLAETARLLAQSA